MKPKRTDVYPWTQKYPHIATTSAYNRCTRVRFRDWTCFRKGGEHVGDQSVALYTSQERGAEINTLFKPTHLIQSSLFSSTSVSYLSARNVIAACFGRARIIEDRTPFVHAASFGRASTSAARPASTAKVALVLITVFLLLVLLLFFCFQRGYDESRGT